MELTSLQKSALTFIGNKALSRKAEALLRIDEIIRMSNLSSTDLTVAKEQIRTHARVALHFHPDRLSSDSYTVAESLWRAGEYRNQFDTQISNGKVAYEAGGDRDRWERGMFGWEPSLERINGTERPKYGALDLMRHPDGPSPRFGSCYFVLNASVSDRCTFSYLDSHKNPVERGTIREFDDILSAVLTECFERSYALGTARMTPSQFIHHMHTQLSRPYETTLDRACSGNLDHYIEAQVHGPINLNEDVEMVVVDPSFETTHTGDFLRKLCQQYGITLHWHPGFELLVSEVPLDFRGPTMPSLARRIAPAGVLTTRLLGDAAREVKQYPERWTDRGTPNECLQELKLLWHVLVKFGKPYSRS